MSYMGVPDAALKEFHEALRRDCSTDHALYLAIKAAEPFIAAQTLRDAANDIAYKNFEAWLLERANRIDGGTS